MPESPHKAVPHPAKRRPNDDVCTYEPAPLPWVELGATSNFTFLTGASHPEEYVQRAVELGYHGLAITDRCTLAGLVRAHVAAKQVGLPLAVGSRLVLQGDQQALEVLVYPTDRASYGRLCRLLTLGKRRAPKDACHLELHDLLDHQQDLLAVVLPPDTIDDRFLGSLQGLRDAMGDRLSLGAALRYGPEEAQRLQQLADLCEHTAIPAAATNLPLHHVPARKVLQDVLVCIREHTTLDQAGLRLEPNAECTLKPPEEMHRLFAATPLGVAAIHRSVRIVQQASRFSLDQLRYEYPRETCPPGMTPMDYLRQLTWAGAAERLGEQGTEARRHKGTKGGEHCSEPSVPSPHLAQIQHELDLIAELDYPAYFLTVYDIVRFARSRGILCQGRGAAANSVVCFCLGITSVNPRQVKMLFERFISKERNEPPDIDIDFEHERREEVIQYIYQKYGRDRAALCAEVITYRGRSAVREVGKALGLSLDLVDRLAKTMDWWDIGQVKPERLEEMGLNPQDPTLQRLIHLCTEILGFPRHLSQHVGGFVLTDGPLCASVPIANAAMPDRTVIEWDKDDIDALGMLKVDCLGLGMMTCLRKALTLVNTWVGERPSCLPPLALHTIPPDDPAVYDMICRADTVGVFQIESRAQMQMLPRLRPRNYYDLVIEVAIVRPGPIQGDMVHPYLRRRNGEEPVAYPDERARHVLERTLGVPLFQEQAMALAIDCAGFTPGEADQLRRAIAAWKRKQKVIREFGRHIVKGMVRNGYTAAFAQQCFKQIQGFSEYGFPESHAASFAHLVYASAYLKHHYPAAFAAALINSQPMGFYPPAQIVRDAREHGVEVRAIDVNASAWDCSLEERDPGAPKHEDAKGRDPEPALRLGMRLVKGLREDDGRRLAAAVDEHGPFAKVQDLWRTSGVSAQALRRLASADAFGSMGLDRQHALWAVRGLRDRKMPLFDSGEQRTDESTASSPGHDVSPSLPPTAAPRQVAFDYWHTGLSIKAHPVVFMREMLDSRGVTPSGELMHEDRWPHGKVVRVAGLCTVRQRPGTASGVMFMTLEDETGVCNLVVRPSVYQRDRQAAAHQGVILAHGRIERNREVVHIMTCRLQRLDLPENIPHRSRNFR